jgi:DNA-binding MarR family transcriptional regulator
VKESPQATALNQAVGQRRKADGQHHSADEHSADEHRADEHSADEHSADEHRADEHRADEHRADVPADAAAGLIQLSGLVHGLYARISQRHDLTPVQAKLLCIVAENPRGMAELAQCFGVEKAALTGLVDRVERRGLAKRTPVHGDRRALHVTLTEAGRRAAAAFHGEVTAELERLLASLTPPERKQFGQATAAIIAACRTLPSGILAGAAERGRPASSQ